MLIGKNLGIAIDENNQVFTEIGKKNRLCNHFVCTVTNIQEISATLLKKGNDFKRFYLVII